MENILVTTTNLTKKYNEFTAVNNLSISIRKGEIVGFLGPNGAGKTTTISMLSTVLKPTSGEIIISGHNIVKEPQEARKRIGVCPQELVFYDYLTAKENVEFFAYMHNLTNKKVNGKLEELFNDLGLTEKINARSSTLSGGQKRRLNVLMALIMDPELVFLDEPTAGLDPQASRLTWNFIREVRNKGKTVLVTTHNMREAEELCDRIYIIDNGEIIAEGTPQSIKANVGEGEIFDFQFKEETSIVLESVKEKIEKLGDHVKKVEILSKTRLMVVATGGVRRLLDFENQFEGGLENLENLTIRSQNLEDVFLLLTGKKLRE
jgi:ABC-2 type transport system ATP-binding protein